MNKPVLSVILVAAFAGFGVTLLLDSKLIILIIWVILIMLVKVYVHVNVSQN